MRKFKVIYSDKTFSDRPERFETEEYTHNEAHEMAACLELMGCHELEVVPVKRAA